MISSASTLLLATLVFNAASVFGAPLKYPDADMVVRAEITEPILPRVRIASSREIPEVRDTVLPPVEKREASTEESNLHRRFPRKVYHDFYQKRADPVLPPVARAPKPDSERRFPRRVYSDLYADVKDLAAAAQPRAEKQVERRYPRRVLYEKRHDVPAPVPTTVANPTDTTSVINNFINSTANQSVPPGTTIKETTVLMNKVTYVSDKNAPAGACNPAPPAGSSSIPSGSPTSTTASPTATDPAAATSSTADPAATSSAADPAVTSSAASSTSDAQPTATPAPAADAKPTTTSAVDPAAPTDGSNSRRSVKDAANEPVAREPEPIAAAPASEKPQRRSGPKDAHEPAFVPRTNVQRTSGPSHPGTLSVPPAPAHQGSSTKRGPILPRRLGFSGAALASLARRSNDH